MHGFPLSGKIRTQNRTSATRPQKFVHGIPLSGKIRTQNLMLGGGSSHVAAAADVDSSDLMRSTGEIVAQTLIEA